MHGLHPDVAAWVGRALGGVLTPAQAQGVPRILAGENVLVSSPTGSGKTLAAFLGVLSELCREDDAGTLGRPGIRCVYVSPLKALARDVARNLLGPLEGVGRGGRVRVAMRTGDTPPSERARMARDPPHVLVTTPESLALVLGSPRLRPALAALRWVVVDEVHALMGTKRGAHLALSLERLPEAQRIGLSATVRPLEEAARFLCGARPCAIVEVPRERAPRLVVGRVRDEDEALERAAAVVQENRATLVFTNTRASAERVAARLAERLGDAADEDPSVDPEHAVPDAPGVVAPHHGSMSREARVVVEERLKRSELRCVVASSSLELGIHADEVDAVVLLGSPKSSARALQRVGRSGHRVGGEPRGWLLAEDADEVLEGAAVALLAARGEVEPTPVPPGGLDVLAQHLLGLALEDAPTVDHAWALARRAWPYRDLPRGDVDALVAHLADARLVRRDGARFEAAGGRARMTYAMTAGAIPDAALLRVLDGGRYVGEVDEAFAEALQPGDVFQLAGRAWRFERALGRSVHVAPAPGRRATVPAWRSEGLSASPLVMTELQRLVESEGAYLRNVDFDSTVTLEALQRLLRVQRAFAPEAPGEVLAEAPLDEDGNRALVLHARLGRRANEALARGLAAALDEPARPLASDLGVALLARRGWKPTPRLVERLLARPLALPDLVASEAYRRRFRHVAQRAYLLPRRDASLLQQQNDATRMLGHLLATNPTHPVVRETTREVLHDSMDLEAAESFRRDVHDGRLRIRLLDARPVPSPLAACILHPRGSPMRAESLRDAVELAEAFTRGRMA